MKLIVSELATLFTRKQERNVRILLKFFLALLAMVTVYSILFHLLMLAENRQYSWITGLYWTLTVMSTLGFGDITFTSDLGKLFSIVVLISGVIFLLTMLPFIFIQFFYLPWLEYQTRAGTPRELPAATENHVILTNYDPITINLVERLRHFGYEYVILIEDVQKALELNDLGYQVIAGELDDPDTYRRARADKAALVVANNDDMMNTNIASTVREVSQGVPMLVNADLDDSVDILELAGSTHVFQFMKMLGQSLARRVLGTVSRTNIIGRIDSLLIAEASVMRTPLVGKNLFECCLPERIGVTVVGIWERGKFRIPTVQTPLTSSTVLLLAGSPEHLQKFDEHFSSSQEQRRTLVLILGGGRVGRAAASALGERGIDYRIIEKNPRLAEGDHFIQGSAADINTLVLAGIKEASSILITTHDDPTNIYLTIYCRKLRPDIQIISRATYDRSISKLHAAGADLVMSYASMAANMILDIVTPDEVLMLAEGLSIFRVGLHPSLAGRSIAESRIRTETGCSVIAVYEKGEMIISPDPSYRFTAQNELVIIGTNEAEGLFFEKYPEMTKLKHP